MLIRLSSLAVAIAVTAALALLGCAGHSALLPAGGTGAPAGVRGRPDAAAQLAPPSALHGASYNQQDLFQWGSQYSGELPQNNVTREGNIALFTPSWTTSGGQFADLAFALYQFNLADYSLQPSLCLTWTQVNASGNCWVAFANFTTDRWDWVQLPGNGLLAFDPAKHISGANLLYAVVLLTGTSKSWLEHLRVGPDAADFAWPMFGHDAHHTFQSQALGPQTNQVKWALRTTGNGFEYTSAAVSEDGTIYFGAGPNLYALNPDGSVQWIVDCCNPGLKPVVTGDGTILVYPRYGSPLEGILLAFNTDGSEKWKLDCGILTAPVAGADGCIYALVAGGQLAALYPDGSQKWLFNPPRFPVSSIPAITADGTVYFGCERLVIAISRDGEEQWTYETTSSGIGSLSVGPDGTVYATGFLDGMIYALQPDGTLKWSLFLGGDYHELEYPPAFLPSGKLLVAAGYKVTALNADGSLFWSLQLDQAAKQPLAASESGTVYVATGYTADGPVYAINPDGSLQWTTSAGLIAPAIGLDGNIYVASGNGFTALNAAGNLAWMLTAGDFVAEAPVIAADGTVYAKTPQVLHAIDPAGRLKWTFEAEGAEAAVTSDGTVMVGQSPVYALTSGGNAKWEIDIQRLTPLTVAPDDIAYFGSGAGLRSLSTTGALEIISDHAGSYAPTVSMFGWIYFAAGKYFTRHYPDGSTWTLLLPTLAEASIGQDGTTYVCSPSGLVAIAYGGGVLWTCSAAANCHRLALGPDGTIYTGAGSGHSIYAIDKAGAVKWSHEIRLSSMAIDAAGVIFAGSASGLFALLDASDHAEIAWAFAEDRQFGAPAIGPDGSVCVGCENGYIYAIGPGDG